MLRSEPPARRTADAAARTVAAGSARLFAAWSEGTPVPEAADRRGEGVADFRERLARVWQLPLFTARLTSEIAARYPNDDGDLGELSEPQETIYDGANVYLHVADSWTGFDLGDPEGPRGVNDPLWALDALFGATDEIHIGAESVRGADTIRYRVSIDLARADAALPAGVTVPTSPYRALGRWPGEVWLDAAGLARRIAVITDPTAADASAQIWSVVELWDFGVAADIVRPEPDDVVPPRVAYREKPGS